MIDENDRNKNDDPWVTKIEFEKPFGATFYFGDGKIIEMSGGNAARVQAVASEEVGKVLRIQKQIAEKSIKPR